MKIEKTGFGQVDFAAGLRKAKPAAGRADDFGKWLAGNLAEVDGLQKQADDAARDLIVGRNNAIDETMLSVQKAEISFKLLMEVRNKLISAYEEIQRMQF